MALRPESFSSKGGKETEQRRQLIHDLQTFLWQFEQKGYSKEAMSEVLTKLESVLQNDAHGIGGRVEEHLVKMIQDCHSYMEGTGNPRKVVEDLDQLRMDLE